MDGWMEGAKERSARQREGVGLLFCLRLRTFVSNFKFGFEFDGSSSSNLTLRCEFTITFTFTKPDERG